MGRPFNWTLVSMAAAVLGAGRMLAGLGSSDSNGAGPASPLVSPSANGGESPFAYIREDGSEIRVPESGASDYSLRIEDVLPRVSST